MSKRVLVAGGCGFIGSHLVDTLVEKEYDIVVVDNLSAGGIGNIVKHIGNYKRLYVEVKDIESVSMYTTFKDFKPQIVFHMAAMPGVSLSVREPFETNNVNVSGTVNLLNYASRFGTERFIFSSSSSVYGGVNKNEPAKEEQELSPRSPYALQKKMGEEYCKLFSNMYGLDTVSLRYFNVVGPRQKIKGAYSAAVPAFAKSIKLKQRPIIYGDGEQTRDWTHVKNVVNANLQASDYNGRFNGEVFNIGSGSPISVNSLAKMMGTLEPEYQNERPGDVKHSYADISKAKKWFGYTAECSIQTSLQDVLDWYLKNE